MFCEKLLSTLELLTKYSKPIKKKKSNTKI